jgi:hypothetical protein
MRIPRRRLVLQAVVVIPKAVKDFSGFMSQT